MCRFVDWLSFWFGLWVCSCCCGVYCFGELCCFVGWGGFVLVVGGLFFVMRLLCVVLLFCLCCLFMVFSI